MTDLRAADHDGSSVTPPVSGAPTRSKVLVAGALGAGAALATGEFLAGLSRRVPSLVIAVGDVIVGRADGETASAANSVLGSNNKTALQLGIVVVSLLIGAWAATAAATRPRMLAVVYGGFGLVGAWAAARTPLTSAGLAVASAVLSALVGWIAVTYLLSRIELASAPASSLYLPADDRAADGGPGRGTEEHPRRSFLRGSALVGVGAVVSAATGRRLRSANTVEAERAQVAEQLAAAAPSASPVAMTSAVSEVEGISPYVTPTEDFYRIDTSLDLPQIDPATWTMRIDGRVDQPLELTLDDLLAEELVEETVTISCVSNQVGGDLVGTAMWTGVPLERLFERAGVHEDADQVIGRSFTGWTGGFPRSVVGDGRTVLVAVGMNGEPLPIKHGFPARLIVAGLYGYVSATKWLSHIELSRWDDFDGYWITRGWAKEAPIKITSRIDVPRGGRRQPVGEVVLGGVAWAPTSGISRVEVWLDSLGDWIPADLGEAVSGETWVQWSSAVELTAGTHIAMVRAYDNEGRPQPAGPRPPFPDGAEGYHRVRFDVA